MDLLDFLYLLMVILILENGKMGITTEGESRSGLKKMIIMKENGRMMRERELVPTTGDRPVRVILDHGGKVKSLEEELMCILEEIANTRENGTRPSTMVKDIFPLVMANSILAIGKMTSSMASFIRRHHLGRHILGCMEKINFMEKEPSPILMESLGRVNGCTTSLTRTMHIIQSCYNALRKENVLELSQDQVLFMGNYYINASLVEGLTLKNLTYASLA